MRNPKPMLAVLAVDMFDGRGTPECLVTGALGGDSEAG